MAIITISRQIGSLGDEIAQETTEQLGYKLLDKTRIHEMMSDYSSNFSKELTSLSEESHPGFFERLFGGRELYYKLVCSLIYDAAAEDNIIIMGRGGQFLLQDQPNVLNVRVIAPFNLRVSRFQDQQRFALEISQEIVKKRDRHRVEFIRYLFERDISQANWYDLVINTGKFEVEEAARMLIEKVHQIEKQHPMSEDIRKKFKSLSLQNKVEATIIKEMASEAINIVVNAQADGTITLSGTLRTEHKKSEVARLVGTVPGVTKVLNDLAVVMGLPTGLS